jgi:hypothetical membrane protein
LPEAVPSQVSSAPSGPDLSNRALGLLGLGSTAVILLGALIAAVAYVGPSGESYSPLNHFISELGERGQSRLALAFDAGVVAGGLGLGIFIVVLASRATGRYRWGLVLAGAVAGASGILVGVFPMDTHAVHRIVSGAFFLTGWSVAALFSLWLARNPRAGFPRRLLIPGALRSSWTQPSSRCTRPIDRSIPMRRYSRGRTYGPSRCSNGRRS